MPHGLSSFAQTVYKNARTELRKMKVWDMAARDTLHSYAMAKGQELKCYREIQKPGGDVIVTPNGFVQQSPYFSMYNTMAKLASMLGGQLGLSPATRSKVTQLPDEPGAEDPAEQWKKGAS